MNGRRIKCAIVGLKQGLENVYVALNHPRFELCAVCDLNREPYEWIQGITAMESSKDEYAGLKHIVEFVKLVRADPRVRAVQYYADYASLLARADIEAIFIVVPRNRHETCTRQALECGKYVLCTKPMSDSLASAARMLSLANEYPHRYMCGFQYPYSAFGQSVLALLASREIGTVRLIRFDYHRGPFRPIYRKKVDSGGTIKEEGCHWLDLFFHFSGRQRWRRITGLAGLDVNGGIQEIEDNGVIIVEYEGGLRASHSFTYFSQFKTAQSFEIVGERGRILLADDDLIVESVNGTRKIAIDRRESLPKLNHPGYYEMHDEFARMIVDEVNPMTDAQAAYENMLCTYAAQDAIDRGEMIERSAFEALATLPK